jgi:hypothetical protein
MLPGSNQCAKIRGDTNPNVCLEDYRSHATPVE